MSDLTSAALAGLLKPFVATVGKAVLLHARQLHAERQAGQAAFPGPTDLVDLILNKTLNRLQGGNIDDTWWSNLLNRLAQQYIAPDFLRTPTLQEWLAEDLVADDLKALATAQIMTGIYDDEGTRARLSQSYSNRTGETPQLANETIDVVVAVLVASYIASIAPDQQPIGGMIQQVSRQVNEVSEHLDEIRPLAFTDPIFRQAHTEKAVQELDKILTLRVFEPPRARRNIQELRGRVGDGGDLSASSNSTKNEVLYWTARLCAGDAETLAAARQLRNELRQSDPDKDLSVVDALLAETDGDADEALRILRDHDNSDSRTALFGVLVRSRGEREALAWCAEKTAADGGQLFTAVGWRNWAVCMAKIGKWKEAAQHLSSFESHWPKMPALALVEGVINAALLLPTDHRERALKNVPIYQGVSLNLVEGAENHHSRAAICFKIAEQSLKEVANHDFAGFIADWSLWIGLMDPNTANTNVVRDEIRQRMEDGAQAVKLVPFAWSFNIPFNVEPLRTHLKQRRQLGGLDDHEILGECLLNEQSMKPRDFVTYLGQHKTRLGDAMALAAVTTMYAEALVKDNQTERARELVREHSADLGEAHSNRLIVMIDVHEGNDPRKQLELLYRQTRNLIDLKNLVSYLKTVDDRVALRPLIRKLFARERSVENAQDLVQCFADPSSFDYEAIIQFLEDNPDILERSDDLKAARAWALFHAGQLQDSLGINNILRNQRINHDDLYLAINIAISSGDWEQAPAILALEWPRRESHNPKTLMHLAQLSGQHSQTSDRALQLAKLAVEKAPDDPRILAAAHWLHFRLGHDDEADPNWLVRAFELSSADEGPLWRVGLQDLVTEWIPKRQNHLREVERKWLSGEIPIGLAADKFNESLTRLLLHIPDQNTTELDGRRRTILPIIAGGRNPIELQEEWMIGLDVTSIMVLSHLHLLETAINAFHHIKLAPDVMELLFRERDEVRFHQPSRIRAAKQVRELKNRGQLRAIDGSPVTPKAITDEVGLELATLLQKARGDNSRIICVLPVHKVGSLMEQQADTSEYDDLIHSTMDLCTLCHDEGKIDTADYRRGSLFLKSQGQTEHAKLPPSIFGGPIYIDGLTLSYLQSANLLQPIAASGLDIRIHPAVLEEANALLGAGDVGDVLVAKIERIRDVLRKALDSGTASFLPRTAYKAERIKRHEIRFQATASLLAGSAACDALCIDDRSINSHPVITDPTGRSVPIACLLDILRYLVSRGSISAADHWTARHKLRQRGFVFVPLESGELVYWLALASVDDHQLKESAELRILRQTMARIDTLDLASPKETIALSSFSTGVPNACQGAIGSLWGNTSLTIERATMMSHWIWLHLWTAPLSGHPHGAAGAYTDWIRKVVSLRLEQLLLPTVIRPHDRRAHYTHWIERFVCNPLRPANAGVIEKTLKSACEAISALDVDPAFGYLFLNNLPETLRGLVLSHDPEFGRRSGFKNRRILSIGTNLKLASNELFATVRKVLVTNKERSVQDIDGKAVSVGLDMEDRSIIVKWSDPESGPQRVTFPQLALLSPEPDTRIPALRSLIKQFGPTAPDFQGLLKDMETREANDHELSTIFDELANGVAAVQTSLIHKLDQGLPVNVTDMIPQSVSYFGRFSGPLPDAREPESYFREVLVPHRKALLNRDLRVGLDICCLGALRDDLTPGQWVADIDDDTIWDVLASCHANSNPFSLLGALDIALYRQRDHRFREFSAKAVATLLDQPLGQQDGPDIYGLLHVCADFVLNRINLLEDGPTNPGYWKRMCAWMQAGLIVRTLARSFPSIDIDALQKWTQDNMAMPGIYAGLVDARKEPMLSAHLRTPQALRNEILGRLRVLKLRHESERRQMPRSEDIDRALSRIEQRGQMLELAFPGPLEGHRRPTTPVPQAEIETLKDAWKDSTVAFPLQLLVITSQFFALDKPELERGLQAVKTIAENNSDTDSHENLRLLELASIVAAANRDTTLADGIADAVVSAAPRITKGEGIRIILQITLQAAAAHETHDAWFRWLEERLASIAIYLSPPPNECLRTFLNHLNELEKVLPIESWFHIRARSIASAAAA